MKKLSFVELLVKCQIRNRRKKHSQTPEQIQIRKKCFKCENAVFCGKPHLYSELDYLLSYKGENFVIPKEIPLKNVELYLFGE